MKIYETNTLNKTIYAKDLKTVFQNPDCKQHEQVTYFYDEEIGLKVIVAIHNTVLGPALGGTRIWNYATENEALTDVLRLSRAMTYKASIAGLDLGGGKAVIIRDSRLPKTEAFLRKYGSFVDRLRGYFVTAPDMNTTIEDMVYVAKATKHVVCLPTEQGGSGDPSANSAYSTYLGMKAASKHVYGSDSLNKKKIGVEGVGKVGYLLIDYLYREGAHLYVTDLMQEKLKSVAQKYNVQVVAPEELYDLPLDIYSPCAFSGTLNDTNIKKLKCKIVAGCANNQLEDEEKHSKSLFDKGILYAPDFLINVGGLINAVTELDYGGLFNANLVKQRTERIYHTCLEVFHQASKEDLSPHVVVYRMAEQRIQTIKDAYLI